VLILHSKATKNLDPLSVFIRIDDDSVWLHGDTFWATHVQCRICRMWLWPKNSHLSNNN